MPSIRRPHFSPGQRLAILAEYRSSHLTQRGFAAQAGISAGTLQNWLKAASSSATPAFVELPRLNSGHSGAATYKLSFPSGAALEVPLCFQTRDVRELIGLLKGL